MNMRFYRVFCPLFIFVVMFCGTSRATGVSDGTPEVKQLAPHVMGHVDKRLFLDRWSAYWIGVPNENPRDYGVRMFRKIITEPQEGWGEHFWVHVSADERYKLYVNGELISVGPARGDLHNWKFETLDLRPYLHEGKNAICAMVWYFDTMRPVAQMTYGECGFLMQGDTKHEEAVNTDNSWRCIVNKAYSPCHAGSVRGYYAAGANEQVDLSKFPKEWLNTDFDDSQWKPAYGQFRAAMKGATNYSYRQMTERTIPQMDRRACGPMLIRYEKQDSITTNYPMESAKIAKSINIAPKTKYSVLLDQKELVTGYLNLMLKGGKGAVVTIGYAETLFRKSESGALLPVGDRNLVEGKEFLGYKDRILLDETDDFCYSPLWWRTWRYVLLEIETKDAPLTIERVWGETSMYPFEKVSTFVADEDPDLRRMEEVGWRTARLCANETYMDCPYYEQLQYFGDTRIQTMVTMYNTRDSFMVKQALDAGMQSVFADGLTQSRFPSSLLQVISSYSLSWCGMVYDYWMYRDDPQAVRTYLPSIRRIIAWYEQHMTDDGSLDKIPYWFFCDWASNFPMGEPIRQDDGYSAYQDLVFMKALEEAAAMERALGIKGMAEHYDMLRSKISAHFIEKYWDNDRHLFADTKDKRNYSQHTNIMAILCDILPASEARALCEKVLADKSLTQVTIYFRYYLFAALKKAGLSHKFLDETGVFRKQLKDNMTTWAEMPEPTRSDCHAWGASPNIEFFRILLGIDSAAPGFKRIVISPSLGNLKHVSGSIPHPQGTISVTLDIQPDGKLKKKISVPSGVECDFVWQGKTEKISR